MPLSDWVRKLFGSDSTGSRAPARRDEFVRLRVRRMEDRRVFSVTAVSPGSAAAVNEGTATTLTGGTYQDNVASNQNHTITVDWGDTQTSQRTDTAPNAQNVNVAIADFQHTYANDGTYNVRVTVSGNDGTPLSSSVIQVTVNNVAPTLTGKNNLAAINEDTPSGSNFGTAVSALIAGQANDIVDTNLGIAVTGVTNTNGTYEYSLDGGNNWSAFGTVTPATARLLASTAFVRFLPNSDYSGSTTGGITFRAWDGPAANSGTQADATTGGGATNFSSASFTSSITVAAVNDAPTRTTPASLTAISVNEDSANATAVTLGLSTLAYDQGGSGTETGQTLTYTITAIPAYVTLWKADGTTQVLANATLSLTDLRGLKYKTVANANGTGSITWTVVDDGGTTNGGSNTLSQSLTITVAAVDDPPTVTTTGGATTYLEGNTGVVIDSGVLADDIDSSNINSATITITNYAGAEDQLVYVNGTAPGVLGSYSAGTLTLSGAASPADYSIALQSIKYHNTSNSVTAGDRTISFTVVSSGQAGNAATKTVTVKAVNQPPERTAPAALPTINVDEDGNNTTAVTLGLSSLAYGPGGGTDESTQILTYKVTAIPSFITLWKSDGTTQVTANTVLTITELQGLKYKTVANANGSGTITWTVKDNGGTADGGNDTLTETMTVNVDAVNDIPVRTVGTITPVSVNEDSNNTTAVSLGIPATLAYGVGGGTDESTQQLTYTVTAIPAFVTLWKSDGTTQVFMNDTVTLTELRGLKYKTVADGFGTANITWTVKDDGGTGNGGVDTLTENLSITVASVNDPPVRTAPATLTSITVDEDGNNTTAVSLGLAGLAYNVGGSETGQTLTYTVTSIPAFITLWKSDGTTQVAANTVLTLTELQGLKYKTVANANGTGNLTWTVVDTGGTSNGGVNTLTENLSITVNSVNDAPVRTAPASLPSFTVAEDADNTTAVTLNLGNLAYNAGGGESQTLTYTVTSIPSYLTLWLTNGTTQVFANDALTLAQLQGLKYKTVADANGTGSITWTVVDNGGTANGGIDTLTQSMTFDVTAVDDPAAIVVSGGSASYAKNGAAVAVDPAISVTDVEGDDITGATITITNVRAGDLLSYSDTSQNKISGSYLAGVLTLTGTASAAEYQAALRLVTYDNTNVNPNSTTRTISFLVRQGLVQSNTPTRSVAYLPNAVPTVTVAGNLTFLEGGSPLQLEDTVTVADSDDPNFVSATVQITNNYVQGEDVLTYTPPVGSNIQASFDATTGTLTLTRINTSLDTPKADWKAALEGVFYVNNNAAVTQSIRTVAFIVNDGESSSAPSNKLITVTPVNDEPVRTSGPLTAITANEDSANTTAVSLGLSGVAYGPGGGSDEAGQTLTYRITAIPSFITLFMADGTTQVNVNTGLTITQLQGLKYKTVANANGTGNITWTVTDNGGTANGGDNSLTDSLSVTINAVNDPPTRTAGTITPVSVLEDSATTTAVSLNLTGLTYGVGGGSDESTTQTLTYTITAVPSYITLWKSDGTTPVTAGTVLTLTELRGLKYKTVADAVGTGSSITWTVVDDGDTLNGGNRTLTETLAVTVTAVNDPPVRTSGPLTAINVDEDFANTTAVSAGLTGVTYGNGGGADESGTQALTYKVTAIPSFITLWLADGTTQVSVNQTLSLAQLQGLKYKTIADANGSGNITWTVQDTGGVANGGADTLAESLGVTVNAVNDPPTFVTTPPVLPTSITLGQNTPSAVYSFSFTDIDNPVGSLTVAGSSNQPTIIANNSTGIAIVNNGDGTATLRLTPVSNASGDVVITITVSDGAGGSVSRQINVRVNNPPTFASPPVNQTFEEDLAASIPYTQTILVSDSETPADQLVVTASSNNQNIIKDSNILVTNEGGGSRKISITPEANWAGTVKITLTVTDGGGISTPADYFITIRAVNDPPVVASPQLGTTDEDTVLSGTLLATSGDNERPGQVLTYTVETGPTSGILVLNANGTFTYTPKANYSGPDQFMFRVTDDGSNDTAIPDPRFSFGLFNITINPKADDPSFPVGYTIAGDENTAFQTGLIITPSDTDGSEAITKVVIANVPSEIQVRGPDGVTVIVPTSSGGGLNTYSMSFADFQNIRFYAADNFPGQAIVKIAVTATSTETGTPSTYAFHEKSKMVEVPVLIRNVAPNIALLSATNVDGNATTNLTSRISDAPRDTFNLEIRWGISKTGFPSTTFLAGLSPNNTLIAQSFQFLVAPDPTDPSAPIQIELIATDKDGGVSTRNVTIQVPGTGIPTPIVRDLGIIDAPSLLRAYSVTEQPDVRTTIPTAPTTLNDRRFVTQRITTVERSVELRKVRIDETDGDVAYQLPLSVIDDLPSFLADLPDGRYRLYLRENDFTMPRMLADVVVFRGRAVSEGDLQADRPPKQTLPGPTEVPTLPPIAKTPGSNESSADLPMEEESSAADGDGPQLRNSGSGGPGLRGPSLRDPGLPDFDPELQEKRGRAP